MFRRSSSPSTPESAETESAKPGGKGRPTPTRKEAEAAARERARLPKDRKALAARQRAARVESSRKIREAMKTGDEKYLLPRDKGPVKRFVRDFVDSRIGFTELLLPLLLCILLLNTAGTAAAVFGTYLGYTTILLTVADVFWLRYRVRKAVRERFGAEHLKGVTSYAVMRSLNIRFLRMPKPQVKLGQTLPETYR